MVEWADDTRSTILSLTSMGGDQTWATFALCCKGPIKPCAWGVIPTMAKVTTCSGHAISIKRHTRKIAKIVILLGEGCLISSWQLTCQEKKKLLGETHWEGRNLLRELFFFFPLYKATHGLKAFAMHPGCVICTSGVLSNEELRTHWQFSHWVPY